jgi:hypothetical protein
VNIIVDTADAVVAALNGHEFSQSFTTQREYRVEYNLKDMKDQRVTVVPKAVEMTTAGRGLAQNDIQIDLAVQKKLTACDNGACGERSRTEIDALMGLVQEIAEFVRATCRFGLPLGGDAVWVRAENAPIYSQEHLGEMRLFTSVLTVTLRVLSS